MRGKESGVLSQVFYIRITPAHAGKSLTRELLLIVSRDHPRTCGEKTKEERRCRQSMGSPPHMRGKGGVCLAGLHHLRITPAHAGKSALGSPAFSSNRDHPRTCGEKASAPGAATPFVGSPPHMRGKVLAALMPTNALGITPAHAGKSRSCRFAFIALRDHPRTCGEKAAFQRLHLQRLGSPPHMRGKEIDAFGFPRGHGITPAHAGKRRPDNGQKNRSGDHPRTCGEKSYHG